MTWGKLRDFLGKQPIVGYVRAVFLWCRREPDTCCALVAVAAAANLGWSIGHALDLKQVKHLEHINAGLVLDDRRMGDLVARVGQIADLLAHDNENMRILLASRGIRYYGGGGADRADNAGRL